MYECVWTYMEVCACVSKHAHVCMCIYVCVLFGVIDGIGLDTKCFQLIVFEFQKNQHLGIFLLPNAHILF